jgi:peptide/nickel transport system permease protein
LISGTPSRRGAVVGGAIVATAAAAAVLAPWLDAHAPIGKDVAHGLGPTGLPLPPSRLYPLGTDFLGRCVLSRLLHGARISLATSVSAALIAVAVGVAVGLVAGYKGGRWDAALMRLVDAVAAFPLLLVALAAAAAMRGGGAGAGAARLVVVLGALGWPSIARVVRAKVRAVAALDHVLAARALGAGHARVLFRHVLPGVAAPLLALAPLAVPQMMLAESALAYLGLGVAPPAPTWGRMLGEAQPYLRSAPWTALAPGAALVIVAVGFSLLGEGLAPERRP